MTIVYNDSTGAVVYQAVDNTTDAVELAATLGLDSWELLDDQDRTIRTVFPRMELVYPHLETAVYRHESSPEKGTTCANPAAPNITSRGTTPT